MASREKRGASQATGGRMTGSQPVVGEQPDAEEVGKQGGQYADEAMSLRIAHRNGII